MKENEKIILSLIIKDRGDCKSILDTKEEDVHCRCCPLWGDCGFQVSAYEDESKLMYELALEMFLENYNESELVEVLL